VSARFAFADGVTVTFSDTLEVSLDCCICHRCYRTVTFQVGGVEGKCTPTGHAFPGKIIGMESDPASVVYRLEYWYELFTDAKYPGRRTPTDRPTWGRVGFEVVCPSCGKAQRCSTQTNLGRPWTCRCKCGRELFTETDEMPVLSLAE
jgi:hypothetical protein